MTNDNLRERYKKWLEQKSSCNERDYSFITTSSEKVKDLYTPLDIEDKKFEDNIGFPGEYPYTRGVYTNMYRGRLWTMRQFSGFGSAEDTNKRYHYLLENGQMGLSVAFDFPTLMGHDSDDPISNGEVGVCGVAVDSLKDMETIFKGIPLDKVSTSMTINGPSIVLLAFYVATGEKQGVPREKLTGTLQNDILKEYIAQHAYIFPPRPSLRIITDIIGFCTNEVPKWNTISISGYHIREAGSTAVQELAFTLADGFTYVEEAVKAGIDIDAFAPRLSFFFNSHNDFFEEIAKFRAARRIWTRHMKEKYKAKDPRSWLMRFHTQTAGCSLTAQQPENNIARVTIQALAGVLGGTQSLHTNSMDETWALPTEKAATIALRTQQVIAYESGVANTIDPLAGSYFVEALTDKMEEQAEEYFSRIEEIGGVVKGIEEGYFQREIASAASQYQKEIETNERIIVGVNDFVKEGEEIEIPLLKIDEEVEKTQVKKLTELRANRSQEEVETGLAEIKKAAEDGTNLLPPVIKAVHAYATEGEIIAELKKVFGRWQAPKII